MNWLLDKACYERGCACYDDRIDEDPVDVVASQEAAAELRRLYQLAVDQHTEIYGLRAEARLLKTVMVAAAEEIAAHWDAHCDEEGYGPANLMHRLEKGIASEYAYKAGDFARLQEANKELLKALQIFLRDYTAVYDVGDLEMQPALHQANIAIAKHGGQP